MFEGMELQKILSDYGLSFQCVTNHYDTSRGDEDVRFHFVLDNRYVLKICSVGVMWEERLQEISRLIQRYHSIGVYCPGLIPTLEGRLSRTLEKNAMQYICYVEEFAAYPTFDWGAEYDRKESVEHLGLLAARYTGEDLTETKSMWSIIDLAPLDEDIDEKQENTNMLVVALRKAGYEELAARVDVYNNELRTQIMRVFSELPRCVYQGDLNMSNMLHRDGHFVGLIDFNLAGTDVNINVFLNETNCFPEEVEFDRLPVEQILVKMHAEQNELLSAIFSHYVLNEIEKTALPYYRQIADIFQYPNVCSMIKWLKEDTRKMKCAALIRAMVAQPL